MRLLCIGCNSEFEAPVYRPLARCPACASDAPGALARAQRVRSLEFGSGDPLARWVAAPILAMGGALLAMPGSGPFGVPVLAYALLFWATVPSRVKVAVGPGWLWLHQVGALGRVRVWPAAEVVRITAARGGRTSTKVDPFCVRVTTRSGTTAILAEALTTLPEAERLAAEIARILSLTPEPGDALPPPVPPERGLRLEAGPGALVVRHGGRLGRSLTADDGALELRRLLQPPRRLDADALTALEVQPAAGSYRLVARLRAGEPVELLAGLQSPQQAEEVAAELRRAVRLKG